MRRRLLVRLAVGAVVVLIHAALGRIAAAGDPIGSVWSAGLVGALLVVRLGTYLVLPGWIACGLLPRKAEVPPDR